MSWDRHAEMASGTFGRVGAAPCAPMRGCWKRLCRVLPREEFVTLRLGRRSRRVGGLVGPSARFEASACSVVWSVRTKIPGKRFVAGSCLVYTPRCKRNGLDKSKCMSTMLRWSRWPTRGT
eukprot:6492434-Amphidinium_carterae.1